MSMFDIRREEYLLSYFSYLFSSIVAERFCRVGKYKVFENVAVYRRLLG